MNSAADVLHDETPRIPENDAALKAWEQGGWLWTKLLVERANYDESKVKEISVPPIPDSLADWEKKRPEIKKFYEDVFFGKVPPPPDQMKLHLLSEKKDALNGLAHRKEIRVECRMNNGKSFNFDLLLYLPNHIRKPGAFVHLNFKGNQHYGPELDLHPTRAPETVPGRSHAVGVNPQLRGQDPGRMNYEGIVKHGYAVATVCYGELCPDNPDGFRKSIYTLFRDDLRPDCEITPMDFEGGRKRDFSAISAWAWGNSRIADALAMEGSIDMEKLAVVGHSRLGKTALWTGANDERFKLVISNGSGCCGAKILRRHFGEYLASIWHIFRHWFLPDLANYIGREDTLPVDSHCLIALSAPRAVYIASADGDLWADPKGEFLGAYHASKVWHLYGMKGVETDQMPPVNSPIGNTVRYHVKTGVHSLTPYDWDQFFPLADAVFGKPE